MGATPIRAMDPEETASGGFLFGIAAQGARELVSEAQLCERLTALMRACEGCEQVTVLEVYRLDRTDSRDGCNWSLALMLDPAGVAPETYALAYGSVIAAARERWNLEDPADSGPGLVPDFPL